MSERIPGRRVLQRAVENAFLIGLAISLAFVVGFCLGSVGSHTP